MSNVIIYFAAHTCTIKVIDPCSLDYIYLYISDFILQYFLYLSLYHKHIQLQVIQNLIFLLPNIERCRADILAILAAFSNIKV